MLQRYDTEIHFFSLQSTLKFSGEGLSESIIKTS